MKFCSSLSTHYQMARIEDKIDMLTHLFRGFENRLGWLCDVVRNQPEVLIAFITGFLEGR